MLFNGPSLTVLLENSKKSSVNTTQKNAFFREFVEDILSKIVEVSCN